MSLQESQEKDGSAMCVMINMPPALEREAQEYATVQGTTPERIFLDYRKRELARRRAADEWEAKFDRLVESSSSRNVGEDAYKFNRADAYPDGEFA